MDGINIICLRRVCPIRPSPPPHPQRILRQHQKDQQVTATELFGLDIWGAVRQNLTGGWSCCSAMGEA